MKSVWKTLLALCLLAAPLLAGALRLEIGSPASNPEALRSHAVVVVTITACHSPEKTAVTATAEGTANGVRQSIPLKVIALSTAGTFAVAREWPAAGSWAIKLVAVNPDYQDYATSLVVPLQNASVQWSAAKHYYHQPTDAEVSLALN